MTERTYSTTPQNATPTQSAFHAVANNSARDAPPPTESVAEEPYTIKCICDYSDDDGNTIYCERCDTWQHIECFYHGNAEEASREDFDHLCADCNPRSDRDLDKRKATERQRQQRQDRPIHDSSEKKTKRPPSKSHKKKTKPSDLQVNGFNHDNDAGHSVKAGSPLEHSSHGKKSKGHRSHHSISSQTVKRSPSHTSRIQTHGHPLSPATTPPDLPEDFRIHSYSKQLRDLYENDPGSQNLPANTLAGLTVGTTISQWLRDPEKLRNDTNIDDIKDVANFVKPEYQDQFKLRMALEVVDESVSDDPPLRLRSLIVVEPVRLKDQLIGELNGLVGFQKDYCSEESDHFTKLRLPAPFVFFHPRLPLYIDTRREGSQCRYVRRSCRANSTLDTFITNQTEYHFCITNDQPLTAREKVTLGWDFRFSSQVKSRWLYLLGLSDEDGTQEPDISHDEYLLLSDLIHNALSDYGGCACGLGADCAFVRFHRNYLGKMHAHSNGKSKKGRKPKHHISPTSTGHATNSRDASEGQQEMFDGEDDSHSASGSSRSKPQSRDMSPNTNGVVDASTEIITEREKRKLANIEKTFEKMDQEQPPRKKKRTSDGSASIPSGSNSSMKTKQKVSSSVASLTQMNGTSSRQYRDAGTSRQHSGSPTTAHSPAPATPCSRHSSRQPSVPLQSRQASMVPRNNYTDASTQTDDVENTWFSPSPPSKQRKKFVPLSERLLRTQHKAQSEKQSRRVSQIAYINGVETQSASNVSSPEMHDSVLRPLGPSPHALQDGTERPTSGGSSAPSIDGTSASNDVTMVDAPPATGRPPPPTWQGTFAPPTNSKSPTESRSSDLRVQMPPIPSFSNNGSHTVPLTPGTLTPSSVTGSLAQSPFGTTFAPPFSPSVLNSVGQHPSPVKKKLSLKDYQARLANKTATDSNPIVATLNHPASIVEETKVSAVLEGSAVTESPASENVDTIAASGEALPDTSSAQGTL